MRNFRKRNDGNAGTCSFIASPEVVVAYALSGSLVRDPLSAEIEALGIGVAATDILMRDAADKARLAAEVLALARLPEGAPA